MNNTTNETEEIPQYDIAAERKAQLEHPLNAFETFGNVFRTLLSTGAFAMPYAYMHAGLIGGFLSLLLASAVSGYGTHLLVKCAHILYIRHKVPFLSYGEVLRVAFTNAPHPCVKYAKFLCRFVEYTQLIDLAGCCIVYTTFAAESFRQPMEVYVPSSADRFGTRSYIAFLGVPLMLMSVVRFLKYMSYTVFVANMCMIAGIFITMYYLVRPPLEDWNSRPFFVPIVKFPLSFGTGMFALECVDVIMSFENNMMNPKQLISMPGLWCVGICITTTLYAFIGFFGFLRYGSELKGCVTLNMPRDEVLSQIVNLTVGFSVLITAALHVFVMAEIVEELIRERYGKVHVLWDYLTRLLIAFTCVATAWLVPNIGGLISLIGSNSLSVIGIILPAVLDIVVNVHVRKHVVFRVTKDAVLITIGFVSVIIGTYMSVLEIIQDLWPEILP